MDMLHIKEIYARLQDDESRMVFMQRLQHYIDGKDRHLVEMVNASYELDLENGQSENKKRNLLHALAKSNENAPKAIILYGAGIMASWILSLTERLGMTVKCVCDSNPMLAGTVKYGFDIISPEELLRDYKDAYILISPIGRNADEIYEFLRQSGYSDSQVFFGSLELRGNPYFGLEAFQPVPDEIYVDAGCLDGGTIKGFIDFCGGHYKKIYAMEPDPENFVKTTEFIRENAYQNVERVPKGAWSGDAELLFLNRADGASKINEDGNIKISVTTIDKTVGDDAVTFIKMDIEGAELEALKGAENTIKKHKPKLAICVYHKPEDILAISGYIYELVPEYKFYLRQHSTWFGETVLYAIT